MSWKTKLLRFSLQIISAKRADLKGLSQINILATVFNNFAKVAKFSKPLSIFSEILILALDKV